MAYEFMLLACQGNDLVRSICVLGIIICIKIIGQDLLGTFHLISSDCIYWTNSVYIK